MQNKIILNKKLLKHIALGSFLIGSFAGTISQSYGTEAMPPAADQEIQEPRWRAMINSGNVEVLRRWLQDPNTTAADVRQLYAIEKEDGQRHYMTALQYVLAIIDRGITDDDQAIEAMALILAEDLRIDVNHDDGLDRVIVTAAALGDISVVRALLARRDIELNWMDPEYDEERSALIEVLGFGYFDKQEVAEVALLLAEDPRTKVNTSVYAYDSISSYISKICGRWEDGCSFLEADAFEEFVLFLSENVNMSDDAVRYVGEQWIEMRHALGQGNDETVKQTYIERFSEYYQQNGGNAECSIATALHRAVDNFCGLPFYQGVVEAILGRDDVNVISKYHTGETAHAMLLSTIRRQEEEEEQVRTEIQAMREVAQVIYNKNPEYFLQEENCRQQLNTILDAELPQREAERCRYFAALEERGRQIEEAERVARLTNAMARMSLQNRDMRSN
jgi:hypothetical protein